MIKEILAITKIIFALIVGGFGILGLRYLVITINSIISPLYILLKILICIALLFGAIVLVCNYYLRNETK